MESNKVYVIKVPGRKYLQLRYQQSDGRWKQTSAKTSKRRDAERAADKLTERLVAVVMIERLGWFEFCARYREQAMGTLRRSTRAEWLTTERSYGEAMSPEYVTDVTASQISAFAAKLVADGKTEATIRKYLSGLRRALTWAYQMRFIGSVPFVRIPKKPRARHMHGRPIVLEEFERMLAAVPVVVEEKYGRLPAHTKEDLTQSWRDALWKYWLSGFRLEEAINIFWDRPDRHCITNIERARPKLRIRGELEKAGEDRLYPLTPDFVHHLRQTPPEDRVGRVWRPMLSNGSVADHAITVGRMIAAFGRKAGIITWTGPGGEKKYATAHDLRRSFGTRWAVRLKPVELQKLMRHSSINTTMTFYVEIDADTTADSIWEAYGGTDVCDVPCDASRKRKRAREKT